MSTTTPNLGLFKYNTDTDGKEIFSINQALNANWDILDNMMSSTSSLGESGYMKFDNGLCINYGKASIGSQTANWIQPTLTENGTLGESSFAVATTTQYGDAAYQGFDENDNTVFSSSSGDLFLYSNTPLKIQTIQFINFHSNHSYHVAGGSVYGSNNGTNWDTLTTFTLSVSGNKTPYTIEVNSPSEYTYYKIVGTSFLEGKYWTFYQCYVTATYTTTALNNITFPQSFVTTNYSYSLAYKNGEFGSSYATTLNKTGMTLRNNSSADSVFYIAIGY